MTTMTDHPNVARLRDMLGALNSRDIEAYLSFWADDPVVLHSGGRSLVSGTFRSRGQILGLFQRIHELTGGTLTMEVLDILADNEHGIVPMRVTAQRGDRHLDVTLAIAYKGNAQGLWQEAWYLADDQRLGARANRRD